MSTPALGNAIAAPAALENHVTTFVPSSREMTLSSPPQSPASLRRSLVNLVFQTHSLGLKEKVEGVRFLFQEMEHALEHFQQKHFEKFDPNVGENACAIRAVKIVLIAQQYAHFPWASLSHQIHEKREKLEQMIRSSQTCSLEEIVHQHADVDLSQDEEFLLESYVLGRIVEPPITDPKHPELKKERRNANLLITQEGLRFTVKKHAHKLETQLRRYLSQSSVGFVQKEAKSPSTQMLCSDLFVAMPEKDIHCTPMFWTYKVLLTSMHAANIPLIFLATFESPDDHDSHDCLLCTPTPLAKEVEEKEWLRNAYKISVPSQEDMDVPAVVIEGAVDISSDLEEAKMRWKNAIERNMLQIILAGAADHRQYPADSGNDEPWKVKEHAPSLRNVLQNEKEVSQTIWTPMEEGCYRELQEYRAMATEQGFSESKEPQTFLIQHVYPSTLSQVRQKMTEYVSTHHVQQEGTTAGGGSGSGERVAQGCII